MNMWSWAAWPQWTILILILFRLVTSCIKAVRDGKIEDHAGHSALLIMLAIGFAIGYGAVLHAGGFW